MIKKIIIIALILLLGAACVAAGWFLLGDKRVDQNADQYATTPQPDVTITEGRALIGTSQFRHVEGKITKITDDKLFLSVAGVDWEMTLPEEARNSIDRMNELGIEIKIGTLVTVQYSILNEERIVKSLSRLDNN